MGAYRYCSKCKNGQDAITVAEIRNTPTSHYAAQITCVHCGHPREDDNIDERINVLAEAILSLRDHLGQDEDGNPDQDMPF